MSGKASIIAFRRGEDQFRSMVSLLIAGCSCVGCSGVGCSGVGCSGVGCSGVGCSGVSCSGVGCSGVGCSGVGCSGVGYSGVGCSGVCWLELCFWFEILALSIRWLGLMLDKLGDVVLAILLLFDVHLQSR